MNPINKTSLREMIRSSRIAIPIFSLLPLLFVYCSKNNGSKQTEKEPLQHSQNLSKPSNPLPQSQSVVTVDGKLNDWKDTKPIAIDLKDDIDPEFDLKALYKIVGTDKESRKAIFYAVETWGKPIAQITKGKAVMTMDWVLTDFPVYRTHSVNITTEGIFIWPVDETGHIVHERFHKVTNVDISVGDMMEFSIPISEVKAITDHEGVKAQFEYVNFIALWSGSSVKDRIEMHQISANRVQW